MLPYLQCQRRVALFSRPKAVGRKCGANPAQKVGDRFGITERPESCLNSSRGKRREEILEVHPQDHTPPGVKGNTTFYGTTLYEAVNRWVGRYLIEYSEKNFALHFLEPRFGRFKESNVP